MALSSSSTLAECQAQYDDNAGYEAAESVSGCALFIEACIILLRRVPDEMESQGDRRRDDPRTIQNELNLARNWYRQRSGATFTRGVPA